MNHIRSAGTYALIMEAETGRNIRIGKHGNLQLKPGFYTYIGSAFGPGGIPARTSHHKKIQHSPRWHIDYLRKYAGLTEIWYSFDIQKREHQWAGLLEKQSSITLPMSGFGSSDCDCTSHLFFSPVKPEFSAFKTLIKTRLPNHFELYRCDSREPLHQETRD